MQLLVLINLVRDESFSKELNECQDVANEENNECYAKLFQLKSNPFHQVYGFSIFIILK